MNSASRPLDTMQLPLPAGICDKLDDFRRRVWLLKLTEGILAACFGLSVSYLIVFGFDRFWNTPTSLRWLILGAGTAGLVLGVPLKWYRWVWRIRRLEQVARLLRTKLPRLGDRLLGIIELAQSDWEQSHSRELCRAAMRQVDEDTRETDFRSAVPHPRYRQWAWAAGLTLVLGLGLWMGVPSASVNAFFRWLMPWRNIERYTFAQLSKLPDAMIVPASEPFDLTAQLSPTTAWSPSQGSATYGKQPRFKTPLHENQYTFQLPPQKDKDTLVVRVGDAKQQIVVQPELRPEMMQIEGHVRLPSYLKYSRSQIRDGRGGAISPLSGSELHFEGRVSRPLAEASLDGYALSISGDHFSSRPQIVNASGDHEFEWRDTLGLAAKSPFKIIVTPSSDQAPGLLSRKLNKEQVLLESDVLAFEVTATDDFGIREIGMEWQGVPDPIYNPTPAKGEKLVAAGAPEQTTLEATATLSVDSDKISAQSLQVRLFTTDYLPDRPRVYSPMVLIHILTAEEHAIWLTQQLRLWMQTARAVHERENELFESNKDLRGLSSDQLDQADNRRRLEEQATAENANGRRLAAVVASGDVLIQEALRNDQFNVATLDTWAESLKTMRELAGHRMPSIANLLKASSRAAKQASPGSAASKPGPQVGVQRDSKSGGGAAQKPVESETAPKPPVPQITDVESSFNEASAASSSSNSASSPKFGLPVTTVMGGGAKDPPEGEAAKPATPAQKKVDEAVAEQGTLLEDFGRVMDELQRILGNLEGSTFVKRLKAASRRQTQIARDMNRELNGGFGLKKELLDERQIELATRVESLEENYGNDVHAIQEDLAAYFDRVHEGKFKRVLDEMHTAKVAVKLRDIGMAARDNFSGKLISQTELWADTLDRWAEQLVGPGCPGGGPCPGCKGASLPPSLVLEVMKILEKEIDLREETRATQQVRAVLTEDKFTARVRPQAELQDQLATRVADVVIKIRELPESAAKFAKEIGLLTQVESVMHEAHGLLARPDTGPPTIAAETEAIELLLQTKRCKGGGGGSGSTPGSGGTGDTDTPALALVGRGDESNAVRDSRTVQDSTGSSGRQLPAEFRSGLDTYFSTLEAIPHSR